MTGHRILLILMFLSVSVVSVAQKTPTKNQLEKKRQKLQQEKKQINTLLFKSQQQEKTLLSELEDLNKLIAVRSRLIRTIDQEEKSLSNEIGNNQKEISQLEKSLDLLKKDYAKMIVKSYQSKTKQSKLMFLLSSENFLQAYKRLQYIKQYSTYRKKQGVEIKEKSIELVSLTDSLVGRQEEKVLLIALYSKEQDSVNSEKNSQVKLVEKVKKEESKYIAQVNRIQRQENAINKQITRIIAEAAAKSRKGSSISSNSSGIAMTPEEKLISNDFVTNKGRLPWPTEKGMIVRRYGKQKHPTLAGITIQSNGIQVVTERQAKARSIFKGKVLSIQLQPGRKKMVLVQHGNYISAYKNLDNVLVKRGQSIGTKQEIGTIHTDATTGKTVLAFSLFKNTVLQNPESWISKGTILTLASK